MDNGEAYLVVLYMFTTRELRVPWCTMSPPDACLPSRIFPGRQLCYEQTYVVRHGDGSDGSRYNETESESSSGCPLGKGEGLVHILPLYISYFFARAIASFYVASSSVPVIPASGCQGYWRERERGPGARLTMCAHRSIAGSCLRASITSTRCPDQYCSAATHESLLLQP